MPVVTTSSFIAFSCDVGTAGWLILFARRGRSSFRSFPTALASSPFSLAFSITFTFGAVSVLAFATFTFALTPALSSRFVSIGATIYPRAVSTA